MYTEETWALVSSGTQVRPEVILDPEYLPDYLSISSDYDHEFFFKHIGTRYFDSAYSVF